MSAAPAAMDKPLIVLMGPTASGKTALALALAEQFGGEVVSCDSLAVYRGMDLGTAKASPAERARVPHHGLDLYDPPEACTAGDWARTARAALDGITGRNKLPIIAGGTGLYLRALLDGLFAGPAADEALRERLRARVARQRPNSGPDHRPAPDPDRGPAGLHRILQRLDPAAAARIHPHDVSKVIRAVEVAIVGRRPMTEQWSAGRQGLQGFRVLRLLLEPPREQLYDRINTRAAAMFERGLLDEMRVLTQHWGWEPRSFATPGYKQAGAVLRRELTEAQAITEAQQAHRNYAKRQGTWFRKEATLHPTVVLRAAGDDPAVQHVAAATVQRFLSGEDASSVLA